MTETNKEYIYEKPRYDPYMVGWTDLEKGKQHKKLSKLGRDKIKEEWEAFVSQGMHNHEEHVDRRANEGNWSEDFAAKAKRNLNTRITNFEKALLMEEAKLDPDGHIGQLIKEGAERLGITESRMAGQLARHKREIEKEGFNSAEAKTVLGLTALATLYWLNRHKEHDLKQEGVKNIKQLRQKSLETEPAPLASTEIHAPEPEPVPVGPSPSQTYVEPTVIDSHTIPRTGNNPEPVEETTQTDEEAVEEEPEKPGWKERVDKAVMAAVGIAATIGIEQAIRKGLEYLRGNERIKVTVSEVKKRRRETLAAVIVTGLACCTCGYLVLFAHPEASPAPIRENPTNTAAYQPTPIQVPEETETIQIFPTAALPTITNTPPPTATELAEKLWPTATYTPEPRNIHRTPTSGGDDGRIIYEAAAIGGTAGAMGMAAIEINRRKKNRIS